MTNPTAFEQTIHAFDKANERDPNQISSGGKTGPKELIYSHQMSDALARFQPDASDLLKLAVHSQHIERWTIPRADYPMDRAGYKRWRVALAQSHADRAQQIMLEAGYDAASCQRVADLLQKKQLKRDPEAQTLEDVACLVFLEFYLEEFAQKHDEEKLIDIIRKTWNKMSDKGHETALQLPLSAPMLQLVTRALGG